MTPKAVILAAGKGARLDRNDFPKPLVRVGAEPMIVRIVRQLEEAGVMDIAVMVGHRGEEIKKELTGHEDISANITFIEQDDSSHGGLLTSFIDASEMFDAPTIITMSDLVFAENPYRVLRENLHEMPHPVYTLIGTNLEHAPLSGALSRVAVVEGKVLAIGRDIETYAGLETGIYMLPAGKKSALREKALASKAEDLAGFLIHLAHNDALGTHEWSDALWYDVNTPAVHIRANMLVRNLEQVVQGTKMRNGMREVSRFSYFYRQKMMTSDIVIERGLIKNLSAIRLIPEKKADSPHFIVTDDRVDRLYGERVLKSFTDLGYNVKKFVVPEGEHSKSLDEFSRIADGVFSYGMDKNSIIFSLGGGVVNNLAGVLASMLYRGVELIHISTSSMSQVDAALDFKQAINSKLGKNLVGSYYPASKILIDPEVLSTLDDRHLRNGIAESLKHALTQSEEFVERLEGYAERLRDMEVLEDIIKTTVNLKVPLLCGDVANDFNEMLPQYGHSVGHAIEHLSSYELLHGEAVTIGMCVSAEVSKILGLTDEETVLRHYALCQRYQLPTMVPAHMTPDDVLNVIRYDKHYVKGCPHMALPERIGTMWHDRGIYSVPVDDEILKRAIAVNQSKAR